jgi:hypothetical protein
MRASYNNRKQMRNINPAFDPDQLQRYLHTYSI